MRKALVLVKIGQALRVTGPESFLKKAGPMEKDKKPISQESQEARSQEAL